MKVFKRPVTRERYIDYLYNNFNLINQRDDLRDYSLLGDEHALKKYNTSCKNDSLKIITQLVPQPLCGSLLKGDIFLSQGFAKQSEGACPAGIKQDAAFFAADKIGIGV